MKKSLLLHIALMVVAIACGYYLAAVLTAKQEGITKEKKDLAKTPIAGFHKFAADVEWMFFINYLGSLKTVDDSNLGEVTKRLEKIISYDPNFDKVYQDGVLSMSVADPATTVKILEKACENDYLKSNWQIPFYAGFVLTHHEKNPDYKAASKFFLMAIQRSGDKPEAYIVNSYLRAKAKEKGLDKDEKLAMLQVLYDEWKTQSKVRRDGVGEGGAPMAMGEVPPPSGGTGIIPDLTERLLKAAQELKSSENPTKEMLSWVDKVRSDVLSGQHLCGSCLTAYAAGDKFCSKCGAEVKVWGTCKSCNAVLKGGFCSSCGAKSK